MGLKKAKSVGEIEKMILEVSEPTGAKIDKINADILKTKEKNKFLEEKAKECLEKGQKDEYVNVLNEMQSNNNSIDFLKNSADIIKNEQSQADENEVANIMKEIRLAEAVLAVESYNLINVLMFNAIHESKKAEEAINKLEDMARRLHQKKRRLYSPPVLGTYPAFSQIKDLFNDTSVRSTLTIVQDHFKLAAPDDYHEFLMSIKKREAEAKRKSEEAHEKYMALRRELEKPVRKLYTLYLPKNIYGTVGIETTIVDEPNS